MFKFEHICNTAQSFYKAILTLLVSAHAFASPSEKLLDFQISLEKRYPTVQHLSTADFDKIKNENVVVFDVRSEEEFAVSHIDGATPISPKMSKKEFVSRYQDIIKGKTIVFYCSVGERSSKMAERVTEVSKLDTAKVFNLEGGLFKWHNERRHLINSNGETTLIHPYNHDWSRLLEQKDRLAK